MSSIYKFFGRVGNTFRRMTGRRNRNSSPTRSALHRNVLPYHSKITNRTSKRGNNIAARANARREGKKEKNLQRVLERTARIKANEGIDKATNPNHSVNKESRHLSRSKRGENIAIEELEKAKKQAEKSALKAEKTALKAEKSLKRGVNM